MSVKLTDAQLVMMSAAAQREDRCMAAPETMKGAVVSKAGAKLVKLGFARDIHAKPGTPLWRRDETGRSFSLKLTAAGLKAIAVDEGPQDASPARRRSLSFFLRRRMASVGMTPAGTPLGRSSRRQQAGADDRAAAPSRRRNHRRSDPGDGMACAHDAGSDYRAAEAGICRDPRRIGAGGSV